MDRRANTRPGLTAVALSAELLVRAACSFPPPDVVGGVSGADRKLTEGCSVVGR